MNGAAGHKAGRTWIYPKRVSGKLYRLRTLLSYLLLVPLLFSPFIKVDGEQLVLLNVLERKFVIFGVLFMPQDFYLFVLGLLSFIIFAVLFTAIFGRVWCGWACPQTIFMEMVFRKIEYWIEGDAKQQRDLDASPPSLNKATKKVFKHLVFAVISFVIANTFLAYFIGSDTLIAIIKEPVSEHWTGFIAICTFTAVFYFVFTRVRELVCTVICPYGRLQEVLLDRRSLVVAYDSNRGEPRGKLGKTTGDCVDCGLCVQVCPTGIDIRKGTQMECINCTACIDICDEVMKKIHKPERLIGFHSEEEISERKPFRLNRRIYAYSAIFVTLIFTLGFLLHGRSAIEMRVLRASGTLYQLRGDTAISNLYNAELINKSSRTMTFTIQPDDSVSKLEYVNKPDSIPRGATVHLTFFLVKPAKPIREYKSEISFQVRSNQEPVSQAKTTFIAPSNY